MGGGQPPKNVFMIRPKQINFMILRNSFWENLNMLQSAAYIHDSVCACVCDGEKQIATLKGGCELGASILPHVTVSQIFS